MDIHVEDLEYTFKKEEETVILEGVKNNVKRYVEIFYSIVDSIVPSRNINPEDVRFVGGRNSGKNSKTP